MKKSKTDEQRSNNASVVLSYTKTVKARPKFIESLVAVGTGFINGSTDRKR